MSAHYIQDQSLLEGIQFFNYPPKDTEECKSDNIECQISHTIEFLLKENCSAMSLVHASMHLGKFKLAREVLLFVQNNNLNITRLTRELASSLEEPEFPEAERNAI